MRKWVLPICKRLLLVVPFVLGFVGLLIAGADSVPDALFYTLSMYFLNYSESPANIWIEIARWLAPLATASSVFLAVKYLRDRLQSYLVYKSGKSIAVYGPTADRKRLLEQLGKYGLEGHETFLKAQKYILTDTEEKNLQFIAENREKLNACKVYIKCDSLPTQLMTNPDVRLYSIEENAARLFWKEHCLYSVSKEMEHQLSIVFIGFGKLGEALLYRGLLNNVFSSKQQFTYHIFGDCSSFLRLHTQMDQIDDKVVIHKEAWLENTEVIRQADIVLLVQQQNQAETVYELEMLFPQKRIIVFQQNAVYTELLAEYGNLVKIDWRQRANRVEYILNENLLALAKSINLMYAHAYAGVEMNKENLEQEWRKLNSFTRESNICAADYHEIRLKMLEADGSSTVFSSLSDSEKDLLCELEHIRWCRFHYLNNWKYGITMDGKNKDAKERIHRDLIDYNQLNAVEKKKDRDNIELLLSLTQ